MTTTPFAIDWHTLIDPKLDDFIATGTMVLDDVFHATDLTALQAESGFIDYRQAHLTHGERESAIRGDSIRWIDESCPVGSAYLGAIDELGRYFNATLYTGIRSSEAHYACYPSGFGYKWHSDNPKGRDERVISAVFYLNDNWTADNGGAITVVDKTGETTGLLPQLNRLVVFDSNLLHQVEITHRRRFSIATWLRCDERLI
ncbi:2OG-Fe(II) oxygenase [Moraxella bovis]|uniref:2OG-Fe(II) oxygenase n=1 Tax=Moraxella bovis TaxID=476 RepID=A0AAQ2T2H8_MORBO|nr:2OG-Fe(II) oxygenase [Moraxella bovis]AWY21525.1 2OG-Fe(II) oxygenase [Moraxella bovis]OOR88138.1 2OG-Fe(II) oxygenase [Moraxella bovis]UYZ75716.1 2OG-Fe(II) oxygenase [Moraxella bovis]UYZ78343.1 2OG-Fe(II) oxygenase [Moraxella bovis]UYZ81229.1 2OG-Fe(II) oxygenase [Moraxella bovis]